jgi:hypothetical protein
MLNLDNIERVELQIRVRPEVKIVHGCGAFLGRQNPAN